MSPPETYQEILSKTVTWCEKQQAGSTQIDASTLFEVIDPAWKNRLVLWEALAPLVRELGDIKGFYPDEITTRETIGNLARLLADKVKQQSAPEFVYVERIRKKPSPTPEEFRVHHPTVFILSSPRSGSTLFRTMLAGHPDLNAPPELHLLGHDSMRERERNIVDDKTTWKLYGAVQTLARQMKLSEDNAFALLTKFTSKDLPIYRIYELIHSTSEKPILVEKSPFMIRAKRTMQQAESMFHEPKYIHLVRHPGAVIESLERMRHIMHPDLEKIVPDHLVRLKLTEQDWCKQNSNTREFLSRIPSARHMQVRYEDLVRDPETVMRDVASFIGVAFDPALLNPYSGDRMIEGIGDPNITSRNKVDAALADAWKNDLADYSLDAETIALAGQLGIAL